MKKYKQKIIFYKILKTITLLLLILTFSFVFLKLFINTTASNVITNIDYTIDEPISFLLIGSDYVADDPNRAGARADALLVATLNPNNSRNNIEFEFVSIPRDTLAYIPCGPSPDTYDKITHSFMYGLGDGENDSDLDTAITCTKKSVEGLLNIEIDHYVMATFHAIIEMVDAIGGIDVNSSRQFCVEDEEGNGFSEIGECIEGSLSIEKGEQHLDGQHALGYARERYTSSDYDRNLRQQEVITAVAKKILENPVVYGNDFIKVFRENCKTDIEINDVWTYINYVTALYNNIAINLSENIPVYVDNKTSIYENIPNFETSTILNENKDNIVPVAMSEIYGEDETEDFEKYVYVSRHKLTKKKMRTPTNINENLNFVNANNNNLSPITIEFSSFSIYSTQEDIPTLGFYSYLDQDTLYYVSNMLRKSLGLKVEDIDYFDYDVLTNEYYINVVRNPKYVELEGIQEEITQPIYDSNNYTDPAYSDPVYSDFANNYYDPNATTNSTDDQIISDEVIDESDSIDSQTPVDNGDIDNIDSSIDGNTDGIDSSGGEGENEIDTLSQF